MTKPVPTVYVHDIPHPSQRPFHRNGKLTLQWHDYPAREVTRAEAEAEGREACRFCFPGDYQ